MLVVILNLFTLKSRLLAVVVFVVVLEPSPTDFHAISFVLKVELQTLYLDNIQLRSSRMWSLLGVGCRPNDVVKNVDLESKISDSTTLRGRCAEANLNILVEQTSRDSSQLSLEHLLVIQHPPFYHIRSYNISSECRKAFLVPKSYLSPEKTALKQPILS